MDAKLAKETIQDELGVLSQEFRNFDPIFLERVFRNIEGASVWCDIVQSVPLENCEKVAELALYDAVSELKDMYKIDITSLRWGDAHSDARPFNIGTYSGIKSIN